MSFAHLFKALLLSDGFDMYASVCNITLEVRSLVTNYNKG
jgi:hypothetical protein